MSTDTSWDSGGLGVLRCGLSSSYDQRSASSLKSKNEGLRSLMSSVIFEGKDPSHCLQIGLAESSQGPGLPLLCS